MKSVAFLPSIAIIVAMVVNAQGAAPEDPSSRLPAELVTGNNRFAWDLYGELSSKAGESLLFSPYSISTALAMTYAGARGDTATEMAKTLHFTLPPAQLAAGYGAALKQMTAAAPDRGYQFRVANRLWGAKGLHFLDSFLKINRDDYGAELSQLDFVNQAEPARATINTWVEKQTNGKINDMIPAGMLSPDSRLVLTNAVYFKADWRFPIDKKLTQTAPFQLTAGKTADVELMYQQNNFRFARTDDALFLEMPYQSGGMSMIVLLPTKVDGLRSLEKSLMDDNLVVKPRKQDVRVWLPKFKFSQETQLGDKLSAMGMPLAFSPKTADFSGIDGQRGLFISAVIHKVFVDVDEKGTEAAAATASVTRGGPPPNLEEFKADHPFIFLIRDNHSGAILFLGRYTGPN